MSKQQHEWTYKQQDSEFESGALTDAQLVALVKNGTIVGSTLVRSLTRTKNKWIAVKRIPAVAKFIKQPDDQPTNRSPNAPSPENGPPTNDMAATGEPLENPYATQIVDSAASQSLDSPIAAKMILESFKPLNSTPVTWLLRATMLAKAINVLCYLAFILYGHSKVPTIATLQIGVIVLEVILWVVTGIFFLRWKYQAYSNLQDACVDKLKTTAGWVVAVYFIPIVSLYRVPMAMHEIQSRSKANIGSSVLGWFLLLIIGSICARVAMSAPGIDNKAGHVMSIVANCLTIMSGYLLLKIIRTITEKQRRYWLTLDRNSN